MIYLETIECNAEKSPLTNRGLAIILITIFLLGFIVGISSGYAIADTLTFGG